MINMSHDPSLYCDDDDHIHDREGEMRFYDFKRRLGDKGSEVRMVIMVIFIVSIMVFNIITSTIIFRGEDDGDHHYHQVQMMATLYLMIMMIFAKPSVGVSLV